ncbi:MAG: hypothetical protein AAFX76_11830, partial [Planctomycetota bacterium]
MTIGRRPTSLGKLTVAVAAVLVSADVWGQTEADRQSAAAPSSPREIIDRLVRERAAAPIVPQQVRPPVETIPSRVGVPATTVDLDPAVVGVLPGDPLPRLRREGEFVIERAGRLTPIEEGALWVFAFDPAPGKTDLRPMVVQFCQRLASMQDTLIQLDKTELAFTITGQVHTYRGVNYLLPTAIAGTRELPEAALDRVRAAEPEPAATPFADAPRPDAPETPATFEGSAPADPQALIEDLLEQRDAAPSRPDTAPVVSAADQALEDALEGIKPQDENTKKLRREGEYLVNRRGRLIRGITGGGLSNVLFAFDADGADPAAAEPPMRLMPSKMLEFMEDAVVERGDA